MIKFLMAVFLTTTISLAFGQQKTLAKFIISDATDNKIDVTETALLTGQYLVFYTTAEGELYMSNMRPKIQNSQSFGRLYAAETKSLNETYETYKADIFYFRWRYINDYDSKKGTASIKFIKIYKPQGVTFVLTMIPENLDVIIYKGYMEGTLDFSDYSN